MFNRVWFVALVLLACGLLGWWIIFEVLGFAFSGMFQ